MNKQQKNTLITYSTFLSETKQFFEDLNEGMQIDNHKQHNIEPNYRNILLKEIIENPKYWENKIALDFGCGCGRNIKNLLNFADFKRVDGCDISRKNIEYTKKYINEFFDDSKCNTWEVDGATFNSCKDNTYDFIMSHQVFQHIANYEVRYSILSDMYRVLKPGGIISIHFLNIDEYVDYYQNYNTATKHTMCNVRVDNPNNVVSDLKKIGFKDITFIESQNYYGNRQEYYFKGKK